MNYVYEVSEQERLYEWKQNEVLWDSQEKAEVDLFKRIEKLKSTLRLVEDLEELEQWEAKDTVEIYTLDDNKKTIEKAVVYHFPHQIEVEGEPLWSSYIEIKINKLEVN